MESERRSVNMHEFSNIAYRFENDEWKVEQHIHEFGLGDVANFEEMISVLKQEKDECQKFVNSTQTISEHYLIAGHDLPYYCELSIQFDALQLKGGDGWVEVWGIRSPSQEELEWLENNRAEKDKLELDRQRRLYEELKSKFDGK